MSDATDPRTLAEHERLQGMLVRAKDALNSAPFHEFLGIRFVELTVENARAQLDKKPELNTRAGLDAIHGGAIASLIDATGAAIAIQAAAAYMRKREVAPEERMRRTSRIVTIDLNVDYLKLAAGSHVIADAHADHTSSQLVRVTVTVRDRAGDTVALGHAKYLY